MDESKGILNIGDLAQPVTTLIEKIADATGVLFEPRKIKRLAKSQAEADLIKAKSEIEISDLQRRALSRFVQEEGKKQENLENIVEKTIPLLEEGSKPDEMDDDWIMNFFDKAKLVSDEQMQTLWAKILAGEANQPNSFSKRTVNFLASMEKDDAEMFNNLCRFNVAIDEENCPVVFDIENSIYANMDINYSTLIHLDSIGLIKFDNITTMRLLAMEAETHEFSIKYFDNEIIAEVSKTDTAPTLEIGGVIFTQLGLEILKLCEIQPVNEFFEYLINQITEQQNFEIRYGSPNNEKNETPHLTTIATSQADSVKIHSEW